MKVKDKERADRIIQVFKDTNMNQREFSEFIGVSQQLVSTIVNYSKKPNETILFAIIDNIKNVDPIWLLTGVGNYENDFVPPIQVSTPIDKQIQSMIKKQFEILSEDVFQRISNIEELVLEFNANHIMRRIDQDNSKLVSELKKSSKKLGS
tara:strand:- start:4541 stop:4993 length:453 start_codon:yes stop_codon:yes gene_type:complete